MTAYHDEHENELLAKPMTDKHEGLDPKGLAAATSAVLAGSFVATRGGAENVARLAIRAYLAASAPVPAEPVALTTEARAAKAGVPVETVMWVDRLRHACAASNFHDFDGCDCSAVDLDEAWKRGRLVLPLRVPLDSPPIAPAPNRDELIAALDEELDALGSSIESFWCMTLPNSSNRLLAEDAERSIKRLRALRESMEKQG